MVRRVKDMELQLAREQGKSVSRPLMRIEGMEELIACIKEELAGDKNHNEHWERKFALLGELVAAVKAIKMPVAAAPKPLDLKPLIAAVIESKNHETGESCSYRVTGKRDQRGLIDLEHGLTFTAIE